MQTSNLYTVAITSEWKGTASLQLLRRAVKETLKHHNFLKGSISILLTDNEGIRHLNRDFRQINEPTDVLTFPSRPTPHPKSTHLGDIAISGQYATAQAAEHDISLDHELALLAIHGVLHIIGFNDETLSDQRTMGFEMQTIAKSLNFPELSEWSTLELAEVSSQ